MKAKRTLLITAMVLFGGVVSAQVTKDSISSLTIERGRLKAAQKLNENKLKLAKLENEINSRTAALDKYNQESQRAADENRQAADELSSNPQDKRRAKRAGKAAKRAERSSRNARKAAEKPDHLQAAIADLREKIKDNEQKIGVPVDSPRGSN